MSTADYERGYNEGFSKGFAQAREQYETHIKMLKVQLEQTNNRAWALAQQLPSTARAPNKGVPSDESKAAREHAALTGVETVRLERVADAAWQFCDVCTSPAICLAFKRCSKALAAHQCGAESASNAARQCPGCGRPEQECTCAREWFV